MQINVEHKKADVDCEQNTNVSMKDLVEFISKALVDETSRIEISEIEGNQTNIIELKVAKEDIGKVIGRQGRTADAIRTITNCGSKII